ncbi:hypothetical protein [Enterococcus ureasiticus]|nr:hypothetical protein [Enterococcus ureasiticus]
MWYYYSGKTYTVQGEVLGDFIDDVRDVKDFFSKKVLKTLWKN